MKKVLLLLTIMIVGIGVIYSYRTDSEFKSKVDIWLGIAKYDSIDSVVNLDTVLQATQQTKKHKTRERISKKVKPDEFDRLDQYARNTPDKYSHDIADLAGYLKIPAKNDLEKARLAYTWIATHIYYDDESFNTGSYKNEEADSVLNRRTAVCDGYSSLFEKLGLLMNLEVVKIVGYSKGYGFQPGDKFSETDHAWNAVRINDSWQLIDVTWGSISSLTTGKGLKTTMDFDPYWFSAKPEEFIFSHLPEDKDWQLTSTSITLKQYEELPFLNETLFKLGFDSQKIFKNALSGDIIEFVETFPIGFPVKIIESPLARKVIRGEEYLFSVQSEYFEEVAIIDQGEWINFRKENNRFSVSYIPKGDKLKISVKINWFDKTFHTIMIYEIVDEKKLTAHCIYNSYAGSSGEFPLHEVMICCTK